MNERHAKLAVSLLASIVITGGCASTAPLSFVEGVPWTRTDSTLYRVRVLSVDGHIELDNDDKPVMVSPGLRSLVLEATSASGARRHVQKAYALLVQPCTHYYLAARRSSPMDAEWTLVLDRAEQVAGCDPKEELRKAGVATK
jgi:hypothetical protein